MLLWKLLGTGMINRSLVSLFYMYADVRNSCFNIFIPNVFWFVPVILLYLISAFHLTVSKLSFPKMLIKKMFWCTADQYSFCFTDEETVSKKVTSHVSDRWRYKVLFCFSHWEKNLSSICAFATVTIIRHKCPEIRLFITSTHISIRWRREGGKEKTSR